MKEIMFKLSEKSIEALFTLGQKYPDAKIIYLADKTEKDNGQDVYLIQVNSIPINKKTIVKILKPNAKNSYDEGSDAWNVFIDVYSSKNSNNKVTLKRLIKCHNMSLSFYKKHLQVLIKDNLIEVLDEEV